MDFAAAAADVDIICKGKTIIKQFTNIFSTGESNVGFTDIIVHRIELSDEQPFKQWHRRITPSMYLEIVSSGSHIHLDLTIWFLLVRKMIACKDVYSLLWIEEMFESIFSTLDMKSGYYNTAIAKEHKGQLLQSVLFDSLNITKCLLDFVIGLQQTKSWSQTALSDCFKIYLICHISYHNHIFWQF